MIEPRFDSARFDRNSGSDSNPRGLLAAMLIGLAIVFGGGGSTAPTSELALEVFAAMVFVGWLWLDRTRSPWKAPRSLWIIAALLVTVPLIQLVPLPPGLWQRLPGHQTEREALALVGRADSWRAWSVAPSRTFAALVSLGPCILVMVMTAGLGRSGRTQVIAMVAAVGAIAMLVGVAQLSGGDEGPLRFYGTRSGNLEGFQANRNHAADVLLIVMVAFAATVREWQERRLSVSADAPMSCRAVLALVLGVTALVSISVIVTASRAGTALLPLAWLGVLLVIRPWLRPWVGTWRGFDRRMLAMLALAAVVVALAGAWFVNHNHVIARIAARFTLDQEFRPRIWEDSLFAARLYFPFGSGMGTFVPVFQAIERLENVDQFLTNRAHNDVLEALIEGGAVAIAALLAIAALIVRRAALSIRRPPAGSMPQVVFALATLCVIALHSQVDYPLRSMSLQCLAGLAIGLLMACSDSLRTDPHLPRETASMKDEI